MRLLTTVVWNTWVTEIGWQEADDEFVKLTAASAIPYYREAQKL